MKIKNKKNFLHNSSFYISLLLNIIYAIKTQAPLASLILCSAS